MVQVFKMKKILIIGGGGYVGAELTNSLISKGYDVSVFDLFIYGENVFNSSKLKKIANWKPKYIGEKFIAKLINEKI